MLEPSPPITEVEILNPGMPKDAADDKGTVLDIRAKQANGEQYDVEMQCRSQGAPQERVLYYLTQLYSTQLKAGKAYTTLAPCHGIWIADFTMLRGERLHSVFRLLEVHDHEEFSDHLDLHWIELPRLDEAIARGDEPNLVAWAKFLKADSDEDLERLAMENADIREAKEALERLSADPQVRIDAERRLATLLGQQAEVDRARAEGETLGLRKGEELGLRKGEELGLRKGEELGLRKGRIEALCEVFDIELSERRQQQLASLDAAGLDNLLQHLRTHRTWPDS